MLSSHLSLSPHIRLFPFIFNCITTLSVVSPCDMAKPSKCVLIDYLNNGQHINLSV